MEKQELLSLERGFWYEGAEYYREHVANDAVFVFPGTKLGKEDGIESAEQAPRWQEVEITEEEILELSDTVFLLTYYAKGKREEGGSYEGRITSIYTLEEDELKLMFHQHTPEPGE